MVRNVECKLIVFIFLCMILITSIAFPCNVYAAKKAIGLVTEQEYKSNYTNTEQYTAVPYYRYATRTKETTTSGYASLSGWNQSGKTLVSSVTGEWTIGVVSPETTIINNDTFEIVKSVQRAAARAYYAYTCNHKKSYWLNENASHDACKLNNELIIYCSKPTLEYRMESDDGYITPQFFSKTDPKGFGTIYLMTYKGEDISSWESASGCTTLWTNNAIYGVYKATEDKYQYNYWRWSDWSQWSDWTSDIKATRDTCKKDDTVMYYVTDIRKAEQTISGKSSYSVKLSDAAFNLNCSSSGGGTLKYSSDNSGIVSVNSDGFVQINGAGTAWITVTAPETSDYKSAQKKIQVTVQKRSQTISIDEDDFEVLLGSEPFSLNAWAASGMLSYKSSNTKVLTVSSSGKVKVKRLGKAKIYITALSDGEYMRATKTIWITVKLGAPWLECKTDYEKIKFTWNKVPGTSGYKVYLYDNNKKKYTCKMTKKSSQRFALIREPKVGKQYKVKVRAYKIVDGRKVYSPYSNVIEVTGK